jgi:hypothetical protein
MQAFYRSYVVSARFARGERTFAYLGILSSDYKGRGCLQPRTPQALNAALRMRRAQWLPVKLAFL